MGLDSLSDKKQLGTGDRSRKFGALLNDPLLFKAFIFWAFWSTVTLTTVLYFCLEQVPEHTVEIGGVLIANNAAVLWLLGRWVERASEKARSRT